MSFIRTCNGKFEKEKYQKKYDDFKGASSSAQDTVEDFLILTVKSRLKATDVHHDLIDAMLAISKANLNLTRQAILPMMIDIHEYVIKLIKSKDKDQKQQLKLLLPGKKKKLDESFEHIFNHLKNVLKASSSMLDGKQEVETLYHYFSKFNDDDIRTELKDKYKIIDKDLLDGFIAFRKKYGYFLKEAYDNDAKHISLSRQLSPLQRQEYAERWNAIRQVVTEDMYRLHKRRTQAELYASIKDQSAVNLMKAFGLFQAVDQDIDKINMEISRKLDALFSEKYLIEEVKSTKS